MATPSFNKLRWIICVAYAVDEWTALEILHNSKEIVLQNQKNQLITPEYYYRSHSGQKLWTVWTGLDSMKCLIELLDASEKPVFQIDG